MTPNTGLIWSSKTIAIPLRKHSFMPAPSVTKKSQSSKQRKLTMAEPILSPMLACSKSLTDEDLPNLRYPVYVSYKLDGIRCRLMARDGKVRAFSRTDKLIPNLAVQQWAEDYGIPGFDGEIIVANKTFNEIQSIVMKRLAPPNHFRFYVFDHFSYPDRTYLQRLQIAQRQIESYDPDRFNMLYVKKCNSAEDVRLYYIDAIAFGYEGLIIRSAEGRYKNGRATWNEGTMLKMKKIEDAEATIIGYEEEQENMNAPTSDAYGHTKRSSHKENKVGKGTLGVIIAYYNGQTIRIGSGWSDKEGLAMWKSRWSLEGKKVTFKFHNHGIKNKPRSPIFKGIRKD
jgi:ATP-dependent DNA ligase